MNGKTHQWDRRLTERAPVRNGPSVIRLFLSNVVARWHEWRVKRGAKRVTQYIDLCKLSQRVYPDFEHKKGE